MLGMDSLGLAKQSMYMVDVSSRLADAGDAGDERFAPAIQLFSAVPRHTNSVVHVIDAVVDKVVDMERGFGNFWAIGRSYKHILVPM